MAKDQEKKMAFILFVKEGLSAKEISEKTKTRPNTIGDWITKGNWKKLRDAELNQSKDRLDRIHEVIDSLSTDRLETMTEIKKTKQVISEEEDPEKIKDLREFLSYLNTKIVGIDQGVAMWNKTLLTFHKDNKVSLTVYIEIMNRVFEDLRAKDENLYMKTLDFQHNHLLEATTQFN